MRLRHIKGAEDFIAASPLVIDEDRETAGKWGELFCNDHPVFIEIGMGKGRFLLEMASRHSEINFVGIEKYSSVLLKAVLKRSEEPYSTLSNVALMRMDAVNIENYFAAGEVSGIYLNFSDPWPKERQAKHRLTSRQFLSRYEKILKKDGLVEFKTDNQALFDFSLEEAKEAGWEVLSLTRDLHHTPSMCDGNVMTEYEEKFAAMQIPICKLIERKKTS